MGAVRPSVLTIGFLLRHSPPERLAVPRHPLLLLLLLFPLLLLLPAPLSHPFVADAELSEQDCNELILFSVQPHNCPGSAALPGSRTPALSPRSSPLLCSQPSCSVRARSLPFSCFLCAFLDPWFLWFIFQISFGLWLSQHGGSYFSLILSKDAFLLLRG